MPGLFYECNNFIACGQYVADKNTLCPDCKQAAKELSRRVKDDEKTERTMENLTRKSGRPIWRQS